MGYNDMNYAVGEVIYDMRHIELRFKMLNLAEDVNMKYHHARALARRANSIMGDSLYPITPRIEPNMNPRLVRNVTSRSDYLDYNYPNLK